MTVKVLPPRTQKEIEGASGAGLLKNYRAIQRYWARGQWLASNNTYAPDASQALFPNRKKATAKALVSKHIAEYIASSIFLHCADGFSYLASAVEAHTSGNADQARHMAYYAELRAGLSLLASQGIGVFNDPHVIMTAPLACAEIRGDPTHQFLWSALDHWTGLAGCGTILGRLITPSNIALHQWLAAFGFVPQIGPIGQGWLRAWGLDIRRIADDRDARNTSSYSPSAFRQSPSVDVRRSVAFLQVLWEAFEPTAGSPFEILDKHLLRICLEGSFKAVTGASAAKRPAQFAGSVAAMLTDLQIASEVRDSWASFLSRQVWQADSRIITMANQDHGIEHPDHHLEVISRAAILLRIAAGATRTLLIASGCSGAQIEFWANELGSRRGFWSGSEPPSDLLDMWADVNEALGGVRYFDSAESESMVVPTPGEWTSHCAADLRVLNGCERIALWSLAP